MQQFVTRIAFRAKNDFFCFFDTTHRRVLRATGNAPDWLKLRVFGRHALRNPGAKTLQFLLLSSRTRHSVHVPGPGPRSTNSLCFLRPPFKGQSYLKPRLSLLIPRRFAPIFFAESKPLFRVTISGLIFIYNIGLALTPWFEGQLAQCLADILRQDKPPSAMVRLQRDQSRK